MKRKLLIITILLLSGITALRSHDFSVKVGGQQLFFRITDRSDRAVEVTYPGSIADKAPADIHGEITIPSSVKWNDTTYRVTAIGPKALSGCASLTAVTLPSGLMNIGAFAFEGCTSLAGVKFPENPVSIGQGAFFCCTALSDITFGADWIEVDLQVFRWSDSLRCISIPAKTARIRNLKALRSLESIEIAFGNTHFSSCAGVLYNADGSVLYGCPRAYSGCLVIRGGVTTVTHGALIDCPAITSIVVPATVTSMSFRETSGMKNLTEVVFKGENPIITAYRDGTGVFLVEAANPSLRIIVGKKYRKVFADALVTVPGEYSPGGDGKPVRIDADRLPAKENVHGVKDFKDYE